jgi:hypothetical protein
MGFETTGMRAARNRNKENFGRSRSKGGDGQKRPYVGIGYGDDIERAPNRGGLPGTPAQEDNIEGHVDRLKSRSPRGNDQLKMQFTLDKRKRG